MSETERLARAMIDHTLPKAEWTHEAHLRVGLWHVLEHGEAEALDLLRERIRSYNEATGGTNTATAGYHETITRFYVRVIARFVATAEREVALDTLADQLIARHGRADLPLVHYSAERLFGTEARARWVEPDRAPLP